MISTSGKGLPLEKMALPSVNSMASWWVHSDLEVGFDKGIMMGLYSNLFISLMMSSVKRPPLPDNPIKIVGFTLLIVSKRASPSN